jgi:hypothetical protein
MVEKRRKKCDIDILLYETGKEKGLQLVEQTVGLISSALSNGAGPSTVTMSQTFDGPGPRYSDRVVENVHVNET